MLLAANESLRARKDLNDAVREMSLNLRSYASDPGFGSLLSGKSRRIVLLAKSDLNYERIRRLRAASERKPIAVIIAADRAFVRNSLDRELFERLVEHDNLEWVGKDVDRFKLLDALKRCRRRLLNYSRAEIERAFERSEFVVRYQPKVERSSGSEWQTREAEALVRWAHPEQDLVAPLDFLPEIEAYGYMDQLTDFVMRKTAEQLRTWRKQGLALNGCVNLAPSLLNRHSLADDLAAIVGEFGLDCTNFTLEVVEQDLNDSDAPHLRTLTRLRERGFRLCLDDFRVAARSLAMFEKLPFDEVKIHASSLERAQSDTAAHHILAAVTGLAHNLGMSVCAEAVEDQETFEFLKTIQCDKMQGFLISEAVLPHIIRHAYRAVEENKKEQVAI